MHSIEKQTKKTNVKENIFRKSWLPILNSTSPLVLYLHFYKNILTFPQLCQFWGSHYTYFDSHFKKWKLTKDLPKGLYA